MANSFVPPEAVGFIGLGNMGGPMAGRLAAAGYKLVVADANPEAVARFAAACGCERPSSLAELAGHCRVVITMLPDGNAVREVVLGKQGLAAGLASDSIVIDMSSSSPVGTRALNAELDARGIALVDAPVSGGVKKAVDGTLAIMAGGPADAIERVRGILEIMGRVFLTGGSGSGHAMKSLNNYLSAAALAASAEVVIAGTEFGLAPQTIIDILNASTGRNSATEHKYPTFILPRTFNSGFAIGLMLKDLRLALELMQSTGSPSTLLAACTDVYAKAVEQLGFKADNTEVVRYLESRQQHRGRSHCSPPERSPGKAPAEK
jgi:3-hydroxyisobutyrate dehydrogenase